MKQTIVGNYELGVHQVQLVLTEERGGSLYVRPCDIKHPRIKVQANCGWPAAVSIAHHEALELACVQLGLRYVLAPEYGDDNGNYQFMMTHTQFSEAAARAALFLSACLPDMSKAWAKWKREEKRR